MVWSSGEFGLVGPDEAAAAQAAGRRLRRRLTAGVAALTRRLLANTSASDGNTSNASYLNALAEAALAAEVAEAEAEAEAAADAAAAIETAAMPKEVVGLLDQLTSFGIAMGVLLSLHVTGTLCWRYRCNRRYYAVMKAIGEGRRPEERRRRRPALSLGSWLAPSIRGRKNARVAPHPLVAPRREHIPSLDVSRVTADGMLKGSIHDPNPSMRLVEVRRAGCAPHIPIDLGLRAERDAREQLTGAAVIGSIPHDSPLWGLVESGERLLSVNGQPVKGDSLRGRLEAAAMLNQEMDVLRLQLGSPRQPFWPPWKRAQAHRSSHLVESEWEEVTVEEQVAVPTFKPLPGILVYPNLPVLAFWIFNSGLVKKSVAVLAYGQAGIGWNLLAAAVLASVLVVLCTGFAMLRNFWRHYRAACWKPAASPVISTEVNEADTPAPCQRVPVWQYRRCHACSHQPRQ